MARPSNDYKNRGVLFVEMADIDSMARCSVPYVNISKAESFSMHRYRGFYPAVRDYPCSSPRGSTETVRPLQVALSEHSNLIAVAKSLQSKEWESVAESNTFRILMGFCHSFAQANKMSSKI
jgi:hypothetical protein